MPPASDLDRRSASATLDLRLEAAAQLGWRVTCLDPETRGLWRLERGDRSVVLSGPLTSLNDAAAARISADKFHTSTLLREAGFAVPDTVRCLRPSAHLPAGPAPDRFASQRGLAPALGFAEAHGFPLVVKPNRGGQGKAVACVDDRVGLAAALDAAWAVDELALIQPALPGLDLRVDLLDGALLVAYLRRPVALRGDGRSTVLELLAALDPRAREPGFVDRLRTEAIWATTLAAAGIDEHGVLADGQALEFAATVLNLNRCCTAEVFTELPPAWLEFASQIADRLRLRHCGLDLRIPASADPLAADPREAIVLEANAAPGIMQIHRLGRTELALAAERRVLLAMLG